MAESNRKCSRLGEWFVQEEIARAIDTALETIIGLSKRKQFKYHGGESLFALDFHTERHTSSLPPLVFSPLFILEGRVDTGIASLSSKSLLPCARRVISKWFVCTETHKAELTTVCVCVSAGARVYYTSWEYEVLRRNIHKQNEFASKLKVLLFKSTVFFVLSGCRTQLPAEFCPCYEWAYSISADDDDIDNVFPQSQTKQSN